MRTKAPIVLGLMVIFCTGSEFSGARHARGSLMIGKAMRRSSLLADAVLLFLTYKHLFHCSSNRSFWQTYNPCSRFTALIAASFYHIGKIGVSRPSLVASAIASKSTGCHPSAHPLACTFRISTRPFRSGLSTMIWRSNGRDAEAPYPGFPGGL